MTRWSSTVRDRLRRASPPVAHIVDVQRGPLVGAGRVRRVAPFAITATVGLLVAVPMTTWDRPWLAVAGSLAAVAAILTAMLVPWHRVPRTAQLVPPALFVAAMTTFIAATENGDRSQFLTMSVLPLMWLAIYEGRIAVVTITTATGIALWQVLPGGTIDPTAHASVSIAVFVVCATGMGMTLNSLVGDARRLAHSLREQHATVERTAMMLDAIPEQVSRYRLPDYTLAYYNAAWAEQHGVGPKDAVGKPLAEFLSEDEKVGLRRQLDRLGPAKRVLEDEDEREASGTSGQWFQWIDRYLVGDEGAEILAIGRDVTERHHAKAALAASEARYRNLAEKSADVVWHFMLDPTPHFDYMSPSVQTILGYPPSYFLEDFSRMLEILDEPSTTAIQRALNGERVLERFDFRFRHADGSTVIGETRTTLIRGGLQGVSRDVTELRRLQANVAALALRDPLTGLANRRLFEELLDADLARTERNRLTLAVAFLDLDGFKAVNDMYGHSAGDIVLCETARRLLDIVRGADTVARVGGDEFVFVFEPNESDAHSLLERIDRALSESIDINSATTVRCPASIGVATTATTGYDRERLIAAADAAMYEVKRSRHAVAIGPSVPHR